MTTDLAAVQQLPGRPDLAERYREAARAVASSIRDAKAGTTRRVYASAWQQFLAWAEAGGHPALPATPQSVALSAKGNWTSLRQYLREWLYDGSDRARPCQTELDVTLCFAPLLRWVLTWWLSSRLALAIDPTLKGDQITAIVISVVYRSCAIPVAWRIHKATQKGSWMDPTVELLKELAPAVPRDMTVIVLCDRGISSPKLWQQIRSQGWHPCMRYRKNITFCADGGRRLPAQRFLCRPDTAGIGRGTAFSTPKAKRRCTLLVVWYTEQEEPWIILTDLPPEDAEPSWYALRFWIELGFKACPRPRPADRGM